MNISVEGGQGVRNEGAELQTAAVSSVAANFCWLPQATILSCFPSLKEQKFIVNSQTHPVTAPSVKDEIGQWFSSILTLPPFHKVPRGVVTLAGHKIIFTATSQSEVGYGYENCKVKICIFLRSQVSETCERVIKPLRGWNPQVENH